MDSVVLAARLLLAAVFLVAAVGKFLDLNGSRSSLVGFGVPERVAGVLGTLLPVAELAVAIALVPRPSAQVGAAGALALLLLFCAGIGNALRKGEAPSCNCFGAIHSAPASGRTLARNAGLAVVALIALAWGTGPALDAWIGDRTAAELVAVAIGIIAIGLLLVGVPLWLELRRLRADHAAAQARLREIPPGLRVGQLAPEFSVPDEHGGEMSLSGLLERGRPVVLVFTVAGCGPCEPMLPDLRRLRAIAADRLTVALVGINTVARYHADIEAAGGELRLADAVVQDAQLAAELDDLTEIAHLYEIHDSPSAVVVSPTGTIASATVAGRLAIEALIRLWLAEAVPPAPVPLAAV
jgi:peroxiredoxin